jgi:thioredoxin reductase (NADPH)
MDGDAPRQVSADVLVVGAGPTGLYAAYCAAFRGLSIAVIDPLEQLGGQVTAMYPEKLIYEVAGFPAVLGRDLVAGLVEQAARFDPVYLLGPTAWPVRSRSSTAASGSARTPRPYGVSRSPRCG